MTAEERKAETAERRKKIAADTRAMFVELREQFENGPDGEALLLAAAQLVGAERLRLEVVKLRERVEQIRARLP